MDDLRSRFAALDDVPMPDLWSEIKRRAEAPMTSGAVGAGFIGRPTRRRDAPPAAPIGRQPGLSLSWMIALALLLVTAIAAGGLIAGSWRLEDIRLPAPPVVSPSHSPSPAPFVDPSPTQALAPSPPPLSACPSAHGGLCLGPLDAGTHTTRSFKTPLTYTVSDGWANYEDLPGNFLLVPPSGSLEGVFAGTSDYIGVYDGVAPASGDCQDRPEASVSLTPEAMGTWYASHRGLVVQGPEPVTIGGLDGVVVDLAMAEGETGDCRLNEFDGRVVRVLIGVGPAELAYALREGPVVRLYLLGAPSGEVIAIQIDDLPGGDTMDAMARVVEEMRFSAEMPVRGVIALGHEGITGAGSNRERPIPLAAPENSWATGTNPEVNSIYQRLAALRPETEGHVSNAGEGWAPASRLTWWQARKALEVIPSPELVIIQTIEDDIRCDGTDDRHVPEFGRYLGEALEMITEASPETRILLVSVPERPTGLPAAQAWASLVHTWFDDSGICTFIDPNGDLVPDRLATLTTIVEQYEAEQVRVCAMFPQCSTDNGALKAHVRSSADIAEGDLGVEGEAALAELIWPTVANLLGLSEDDGE